MCQLEKRVHCNGYAPANQMLIRLDLPPDPSLLDVEDIDLPFNWKTDQSATQQIGMTWLKSNRSLGLWVPSFVEPAEANLLLNPSHPQYASIKLVIEQDPFEFDPRLFR